MTLRQTHPGEAVSPPSPRVTPLRVLYGIYAWSVFLVLGLLALLAMLLPGVSVRRRAARAASRCVLHLIGMPVALKSPERLPQGQCVIVANHASYLDGVVMTAALPPRFGFVIKKEMSRVPLAGLLLRRLGSEFVDRFNRHRGAADALRVLRKADNGHSLVFFPEGTFTPQPGLMKFHIGAFAIAARIGCPVVPAVIRGTRRAFPPRHVLPTPGRIEVELLEPVQASVGSRDAAAELRQRSRSAILAHLDEPDLAGPEAPETATYSAGTDRPPRTEHAKSVRVSRP
jgi:1-acyl-sn-glycerol-3-phosphate acyltransferase